MTSRYTKLDRVPLLGRFRTYLSQWWTIIRQIYHTVHMALWALPVAGTAFCFCIFHKCGTLVRRPKRSEC